MRTPGALTTPTESCGSGTGLLLVFATLHNGVVKAVAQLGGQLVDLMRPVDLDGLAGGIDDHFAVLALAHVLLDLGAGIGGDGLVDDVVEHGEELSAGLAVTLAFP